MGAPRTSQIVGFRKPFEIDLYLRISYEFNYSLTTDNMQGTCARSLYERRGNPDDVVVNTFFSREGHIEFDFV